ncbi:MAG: DUF6263 family protein [Isosphaeraceae bacterium]
MIQLARKLPAALALTLVTCLAPAAIAQQAPDLRYKFQEGQTFPYLLKQSTESTVSINGQTIEQKLEQTFDVTWKVKKVRDDGSAEMIQTFDRVRLNLDSLLGQMEFDTKGGKDAEGPMAQLGAVFRNLVGEEGSARVTPLGEVVDIKLPAKAAEALKNVPALPGGQRMLSEDTFQNIFSQAMLIFPEKPATTWTTKREIGQPPLGSMLMDTTYTYAGPDAESKDLAKIDSKINLDYKFNAELPVTIKLKKQDVSGSGLFDRAKGRLVSSKLNQKIELAIDAMGMELEQETKTTVTMSLQDSSEAKASK